MKHYTVRFTFDVDVSLVDSEASEQAAINAARDIPNVFDAPASEVDVYERESDE